MITINSATEVQSTVAAQFRDTRKARRHSRATAAIRSGVPAPTIRRFEVSGEISLRQFLMLCEVYGNLGKCEEVLQAPPASTMDELIAQSRKSL